jgi:hypothetical protein
MWQRTDDALFPGSDPMVAIEDGRVFLLVIIGVNGTNVIKLEGWHTPVLEREL